MQSADKAEHAALCEAEFYATADFFDGEKYAPNCHHAVHVLTMQLWQCDVSGLWQLGEELYLTEMASHTYFISVG